MKQKKFTSNSNEFEILIPVDWEQYDDEERTYAFFDAREWKGNFRITPIKLEHSSLRNFILEKLAPPIHDKAQIGNYDCVMYQETSHNNDKENFIYFWTFVNADYLYMASLTVNLEERETLQTKEELNKVHEIIESLKTPGKNL